MKATVLAGLLIFAAASPLLCGDASVEGEFDRYLKNAQRLRQNRDKGGLDVKGMLSVLQEAGVMEGSAESAAGLNTQTKFRPFQVRKYGGLWRWPLKAGIVSSEFGKRWGRRHEGVDIAADLGVPVTASAGGTVIYSGDTIRGYGNVVILRHDQETTTLYAHNEALLVKQGDRVQAGQTIAKLGSTGRSTGPHVHFELRRKGRAVDPRKVLMRSRF
ncbi:MAG: M23 family metallopeptidase [Elusimicrobiota bacterium]